jgi:suppressor for copper-sensitivity B
MCWQLHFSGIFRGMRVSSRNESETMILKRMQGLFCSLVLACLVTMAWTASAHAQAPAKSWSKGKILTTNAAAEIEFKLDPASVAPGSTAKLSVTFESQEPWYLYERSPDGERKSENGLPVLVELDKPAFGTVKGPTPSVPGEEKIYSDGKKANVYKSTVTFVYEIAIPAEQAEGDLELTGGIGAQSCNAKDENCLPPQGFDFRAKLKVSKTPSKTPGEVEWIKSKYADVKKRIQAKTGDKTTIGAVTPENSNPPTTAQVVPALNQPTYEPRIIGSDVKSLAMALGLALLGGLVLNLMPCVLPVIGLKVLSFVEQAGKDRRQIFLLNLVYSLGIITVFIALAAFTIIFQKGWGQQMQSAGFNITMMAIVFAMSLSFLSVWEIPIPGFATTPGISRSSQRVGYEGAFLKGIVTTLLATPCSGPLLGTVFAFTAKLPSYQVALVFFTVGLGMASPYLIIGTFPKMIKMLPKPGEWMDTFKNLMGFILLGTVVYLFTLIPHQLFLPTLTMLFAIWFALWLVGRVPIYESHFNRLKPWLIGGPIAAVIAVGGFWIFSADKGQHELNWIAYTPEALQKATAEGKTVLLDMTADWCPTCKVNLSVAINREAVKELVKKYDVVAMKADLTEESDETNALLKQLQSQSIPLLAVYPAAEPLRPYVLRDSVWQQDVLDVIKLAGPSKASPVTMVPTSVKQ